MGKSQRDKGKRGEREVARLLSEELGIDARRGAAQSRRGNDAPDVVGVPGMWIEVKIGRRPNIHAAMVQAWSATDGRMPVAFTRRDGESWLVTMHATDWCDLVREAVDLTEEEE